MERCRQILICVLMALLLFSSVAHGDTWTANKRLTNNPGDSMYPSIAVDGSKIYVVWHDHTLAPHLRIFFKRSLDGGATWEKYKVLTNKHDSWHPVIAVNGENIYVVWSDDLSGIHEIYFKRSQDGGTTWTENKRLTRTASTSISPAIAVDGSNIYVVWMGYTPGNHEIYFKHSENGGISWGPTKRLTHNETYSNNPGIAVNGSNIYVVWCDIGLYNNMQIYLKRSEDGGITWKTTKRLTNSESFSCNPAIAVNGSQIYVVWQGEPGISDIYFKRSNDGGITWKPAKRLTNIDRSYSPTIATEGSKIFVVWNFKNAGIYFKRSEDGGTTWTENHRLTYNSGFCHYPVLAVNDLNIYVVWYDDTLGNYDIYFKKGVMN